MIKFLSNQRTEFHLAYPPERKAEIRDNLLRLFADQCGGCTMIDHEGAWKAPNGDLLVEPGLTIIVYGIPSTAIPNLAKDILRIASQQSVLVWDEDDAYEITEE